MAKLAALVALAFAVIVAFAEVSAYKTTITTTTIEDNNIVLPVYDDLDSNPSGSAKECRQIQGQKLNHCQMHLTQGRVMENPSQQHLQLCCNQLRQVEEQSQCEAIQKVVQQAQQQQQQGGSCGTQGRKQGGQQQMQQVLEKAQMLPNQCNLEIQQC